MTNVMLSMRFCIAYQRVDLNYDLQYQVISMQKVFQHTISLEDRIDAYIVTGVLLKRILQNEKLIVDIMF